MEERIAKKKYFFKKMYYIINKKMEKILKELNNSAKKFDTK